MPPFAGRILSLFAIAVLSAMPFVALAQQQSKAIDPSRRPDPYASPLDTILSTRLWTDVPPAQDFVKTTRPDPKGLDYAPLVGNDPERPKPRDAAGVAALKAELESGGAQNETRAKGLRDPAPGVKAGTKAAGTRHARKPAAKNTSAASAE